MTAQSAPSRYTAFEGHRCIATGPLAEVALAVKHAADNSDASILVFEDATGRAVDFDLRGNDAEIVKRLAQNQTPGATGQAAAPAAARGRGRPKLGVVAREVTLLPRHWDWLAAQPGGASVALRKLVDEARRQSGDRDRARQARDAAYHFMSAMAGNLPGFEEAVRALFAGDRRRFAELISAWPHDIRNHTIKLAFSDRAG